MIRPVTHFPGTSGELLAVHLDLRAQAPRASALHSRGTASACCTLTSLDAARSGARGLEMLYSDVQIPTRKA